MNKEGIARKVAKKYKVTIGAAASYLDAILDVVTETVTSGESVDLHGFGKFEIMRMKPKKYLNFRTHEYEISNPKSKVKFVPGSQLKVVAVCDDLEDIG